MQTSQRVRLIFNFKLIYYTYYSLKLEFLMDFITADSMLEMQNKLLLTTYLDLASVRLLMKDLKLVTENSQLMQLEMEKSNLHLLLLLEMIVKHKKTSIEDFLNMEMELKTFSLILIMHTMHLK